MYHVTHKKVLYYSKPSLGGWIEGNPHWGRGGGKLDRRLSSLGREAAGQKAILTGGGSWTEDDPHWGGSWTEGDPHWGGSWTEGDPHWGKLDRRRSSLGETGQKAILTGGEAGQKAILTGD